MCVRIQVQRRQAQRSPQSKIDGGGGGGRGGHKPKVVSESQAPGQSLGTASGRPEAVGGKTALVDTAASTLTNQQKAHDRSISDEEKPESVKRNLLQILTTTAMSQPKEKGEEEKGEESSQLPVTGSQPGRGVRESLGEAAGEQYEGVSKEEEVSSEKQEEEEGIAEVHAATEEGNKMSTPPELAHRLETAYQDNVETMAKLENLTQTLSVIATDTIPMTTKIVNPSGGVEESVVTFVTEDDVGQAALAGALETGRFPTAATGEEEEHEEYLEAVQSSDAGEVNLGNVHVVGEIVAAATITASGTDVKQGVEGEREAETDSTERDAEEKGGCTSTSNLPQDDQDRVTDPAMANSVSMAPRKPKRQLAASFGPQNM